MGICFLLFVSVYVCLYMCILSRASKGWLMCVWWGIKLIEENYK